ncbi:MAG: hypothetical protein U9M97_03360 [Candidatus Hadarchaeota archaeon]|nr:hypothetical protein [Candidatus Hadarchaeota archaeon]
MEVSWSMILSLMLSIWSRTLEPREPEVEKSVAVTLATTIKAAASISMYSVAPWERSSVFRSLKFLPGFIFVFHSL